MRDQTKHSHSANDQPVSIGQVVKQLQPDFPDINPSTLRFLESEGLLSPLRSPGGHRLYRHDDIERIRFIRTMQRRRLPIEEVRRRLNQIDAAPDPEDLSNAFFDHLTAGNLPAAAQLVRDADRLGLPLSTTFTDIIGTAMHRIGAEWERGALLVGQEKEATELAKELVAELSAHHAAPVIHEKSVLAAAVEGEFHDLGLRMVTGLLREQGFSVHLLGADVAAGFLAETVVLRKPAIVLLGATLPARFPAIVDAVTRIRSAAEPPGPQVIVGGPIVLYCKKELTALDLTLAVSAEVDATLRAILEPVSTPEHSTTSR